MSYSIDFFYTDTTRISGITAPRTVFRTMYNIVLKQTQNSAAELEFDMTSDDPAYQYMIPRKIVIEILKDGSPLVFAEARKVTYQTNGIIHVYAVDIFSWLHDKLNVLVSSDASSGSNWTYSGDADDFIDDLLGSDTTRAVINPYYGYRAYCELNSSQTSKQWRRRTQSYASFTGRTSPSITVSVEINGQSFTTLDLLKKVAEEAGLILVHKVERLINSSYSVTAYDYYISVDLLDPSDSAIPTISQKIKPGFNLSSISKTIDSSNEVSRLLYAHKLTDDSDYLYALATSNREGNYGISTQYLELSEAMTAEAALAEAQAQLTQLGDTVTVDINAVDLKEAGFNTDGFELYQKVQIESGVYSGTKIITGIELHLDAPQNNVYTFSDITAVSSSVSSGGFSSSQPTLTSGCNIKMIDGQSILGSGNLLCRPYVANYVSSKITVAKSSYGTTTINIGSLPSGYKRVAVFAEAQNGNGTVTDGSLESYANVYRITGGNLTGTTCSVSVRNLNTTTSMVVYIHLKVLYYPG